MERQLPVHFSMRNKKLHTVKEKREAEFKNLLSITSRYDSKKDYEVFNELRAHNDYVRNTLKMRIRKKYLKDINENCAYFKKHY